MKINSLSVSNFRNLEDLTLDFDNVNIIFGDNAQGKTNIIEALYIFTGSKSFRKVSDKNLIKFDENKANLKIEFFSEDRNQNAEINIEKKREVYLNGIKKRTSGELGKSIKAIVFSPDHLEMIKAGPIQRRNFVDGALCQIKANYNNLLKNYYKALEQRNSLLKDLVNNPSLKEMIYIWDNALAKEGAKIIYQRQRYIEEILPYVRDIFDGLSGNKEKIDIKLSGSFDYQNKTVEELEKGLIDTLKENYSNDLIARITKKGPHVDDIEILINGNSAKLYGSQGQQRSCVLALKLSEAILLEKMTGIKPIALLDDVMSELDEKRQDYILNHIKDLQIFITCCDPNTILKLQEGKTFSIENGKIKE